MNYRILRSILQLCHRVRRILSLKFEIRRTLKKFAIRLGSANFNAEPQGESNRTTSNFIEFHANFKSNFKFCPVAGLCVPLSCCRFPRSNVFSRLPSPPLSYPDSICSQGTTPHCSRCNLPAYHYNDALCDCNSTVCVQLTGYSNSATDAPFQQLLPTSHIPVDAHGPHPSTPTIPSRPPACIVRTCTIPSRRLACTVHTISRPTT